MSPLERLSRGLAHRFRILALLGATLSLATLTLLAGAAEATWEGHWEGAIEVPGRPLEIQVDLQDATAEELLRGTISIPVQAFRDQVLVDVSAEGSEIRFRIPGVPGEPSFTGNLSEAGDEISGTFTQSGGSLPFQLRRGEGAGAGAAEALADLPQTLESLVKDWNVPGLGLAVVYQGELVFAEGAGFRDLEGELPMTADTLFAVGSTTKAFTTTVLGTLSDEGELQWDEPLRTYLPTFRLQDPIASAQVTPRDLVTHRTGLPRHDLLWYNNQDAPRRELVARLAHLEPVAPLRSEFHYNNLMFLTAGVLIEELTGQTWEEAVRQRLLEPLGMDRSTFSVAASQQDLDHALPYRETDEDELEHIPFRPIDVMAPAGAINSSVREMSRWLAFNLDRGETGGDSPTQILSPTTLADLHAPHMAGAAPSDRPEISDASYGMGWSVDTFRGHRRVAHGGGIDGFTTSVMLFPDDALGLVSFTNRSSGLPRLLNQDMAERLLGLESMDWLGTGLTQRQQAKAVQQEAEAKKATERRSGTSPSHPLEDYAGEYRHPGYGTLTVDFDAEDRTLSTIYNRIETPLEHWHYDVFNGLEAEDPTFEDMKYLFRGDVRGNIAAVEATFDALVDPILFLKGPDAKLSDPTYLERLAGRYELAGQSLTLELVGGRLQAVLPGQPTLHLKPGLGGRFVLEEAPSISVGFTEEDGAITAVTLYQPNGVFEGKRLP